MNARKNFKRSPDQSLDARLVLAAAQLRFAASVDFLVARWLERCATKGHNGCSRPIGSPHVSSGWA